MVICTLGKYSSISLYKSGYVYKRKYYILTPYFYRLFKRVVICRMPGAIKRREMIDYTDVEVRRPIIGFPNYEVSNYGRVYNVRTGRQMKHSPTYYDIPTVGLVYEGQQYRRSVKVLVARAFVPGETEVFNTPIQLDGNRSNLHESNIVWRPRWFAWAYTRQFESVPGWAFHGPVLDVTHNVRYKNIFKAAIANGSLCEDIHHSIISGTRVFPTGEQYTFTRNRKT